MGSVLAVDRSEHLRLNVFVEMLPDRLQRFVKTFAMLVIAIFLQLLLQPSADYVKSEWMIRTPDLNLPNGFRVSAIGVCMVLVLVLILRHTWTNSRWLAALAGFCHSHCNRSATCIFRYF